MKRFIDLLGALIGLILFSPLLLGVSLAIFRHMGTPVLFRQLRPGYQGRAFTLWKFRTMRKARDRRGDPYSDEQRLTGLGRFLRRTSIDELPELVNVLKGEMSLVGPRPLLMEYLPLYTPEQARRHEVKPGITGWAQVNGRNTLSWEEKFAFDVWYIDHWSLWLDLKIMFLTFMKTVKCEGISARDHVTMPEFRGSGRPSS